jgi:benzoylformate decarboxylase
VTRGVAARASATVNAGGARSAVDRAGGWDAAVALAEKLRAAVYRAPLPDRASYQEDHPLFRGPLGWGVPAAVGVALGDRDRASPGWSSP